MSELLDRGARDLLVRAYGVRRGEWVMTRLADPGDRHRDYFQAHFGIDVDGPDNAPTLSGKRNNAHSRWGRAFVRALYYNHRHYGQTPRVRGQRPGIREQRRVQPNGTPLEIEWGRRMPRRGVIPAGRAVRVRIPYGGKTALRAVKGKPDVERTWTDDGDQGGRFSVASRRDWAAIA